MKLKLFLLTALTFIGLTLPQTSLAASFSLTIDKPVSPSRLNNFNLTGTSLEVNKAATRNITVKCFKKGPSDSGFTQFDADQILIPGGNVYSCAVNESILNTDGTYSFYTTASVSEPSFEELTSSVVNYVYNTSGPSTPVSYSKERLNSCDYRIKFKTANDGKTVKVQLFRSDTFNVSVGAGSVLTQQNIGPDTEGEFVNSVPQCGKDYYYVLRAVDGSDNASGTIGDSFTTTTSVSATVTGIKSKTTGAIALTGANAQVVSPTPTSASGSALEVVLSPTPTILGTSTEEKKGVSKWLIVLAVIVGYFTFRVLKKAK